MTRVVDLLPPVDLFRKHSFPTKNSLSCTCSPQIPHPQPPLYDGQQVKETVDATLNRISSSGVSGASYFTGSIIGTTRCSLYMIYYLQYTPPQAQFCRMSCERCLLTRFSIFFSWTDRKTFQAATRQVCQCRGTCDYTNDNFKNFFYRSFLTSFSVSSNMKRNDDSLFQGGGWILPGGVVPW